MHGIGEVLEQVDINVKADDKGEIFIPENLTEEIPAHLFFHIEHAGLAAAGVNQNTEGKGKVRLRRKVLDGLRFAILEDLKVIFCEVRDQRAFFIFHIEKQLNYIDVDLKGFGGLVLILIGRRCIGLSGTNARERNGYGHPFENPKLRSVWHEISRGEFLLVYS